MSLIVRERAFSTTVPLSSACAIWRVVSMGLLESPQASNKVRCFASAYCSCQNKV